MEFRSSQVWVHSHLSDNTMYLDFVCNDLIGVVYFLVGDFLYDPLATLSGLTEKLWAAQLKKKEDVECLV